MLILRKILPPLMLAMLLVPVAGCSDHRKSTSVHADVPPADVTTIPIASPVIRTLVAAGIEQTTYTKAYDPAYTRIAYPGGDVPRERGVCSDVVVRAFRTCGVDLQKEIHEDMAAHFSSYSNRWGLRAPDANIDHRRVPNLMTYFARHGAMLPVSTNAGDYEPGDVVVWDLGRGVLHIGIVTNILGAEAHRCQVVHNIGYGARVEDVLFVWKIIGRYRYFR